MEAMAAQQSHEAQLAALRSDQTKKRLKLIVGGVSAVLVLALVGGGVAWNNAQKEQRAKDAAAQAEAQRFSAELERLKAQADEAAKKEEELKSSLASAKDEASRARIEAELAKAKKEAEAAQGQVRVRASSGSGGGSKPSGGSAKPCNCPPGDPLCSCL
jgi:colicin import membrane protein